MGVLKQALEAYEAHPKTAAHEVFLHLSQLLRGATRHPRVPGMDTVIRLAHRISRGHTVDEAAAREYVYRWHLAIKAPDQCSATGRMSYDPRDRDPWAWRVNLWHPAHHRNVSPKPSNTRGGHPSPCGAL